MSTRLQVPLLGVMAGTAMGEVNIASTALVDASRGLGMAADIVPIAASAMSMFCGATVISSGLAADRLGRRRVLVFGLLLGVCSELLTALSFSSWVYIAGRSLTGVSIGIVFAAAFAYVRSVSSKGQLGNALGVFGAVAGFTMIVETFVGGSLASVLWRAAFVVVPSAYVISALLVPKILPVQPRVGSGPIDAVGQVLLAIGLVGPLYAISRMTTSLTSPITLISLVIGLVALVCFYLWERRTPHPFFPVRILSSPMFLAGVLFGIGFNLSNSTLVLQLANVWQYALRMDTVQVALAEVPALAIGVVASIYAGRLLSGGWHERRLGIIGFAAVSIGYASLALYHHNAGFWMFIPALLLVGAGAQILNVPFGSLVIKSAPADAIGPVTASRSTIGSFANAFGMAASTVLINRLTTGGIVERMEQAKVPPGNYGSVLDVVTAYIRTDELPSVEAARQVISGATESYLHAFAVTMGVIAVAMLAMGVLATWLLRTRLGEPTVP